MTEVTGGTPVVQLRKVVPAGAADVFVKLEWFNPTGSYKDRMALAMIEEAERRGDLRPGMTVVEYTGGSTGSSLAFVSAAKRYRFRVVSSDAFAPEKLKTMQAFGAELTIVPSDGGQITPDLIPRMMEKAAEYAAEPGTYWTDQMRNVDSLVGYRKVGEEILEQLDRPVDVFCAAVGTAGLAMGVSHALHAAGSNARVVVFEPASTQVISGREPAEGTDWIMIETDPWMIEAGYVHGGARIWARDGTLLAVASQTAVARLFD
jgi:cysteine synthase A